ncbi:MAG TPA: RHS repeat-associated core domain-containing protein, partial [Candidatus Acidoferrales bacterium]|nr:RHS repeat-associated core domain-containing protein [Candidatus Acidoferrales bacterium]
RVQKTSAGSTTTYIFSNGQVIAEYPAGAAPGSPAREYIYGARGELLATIQGGTTTYHLRDHLSVRANTDGASGSPTFGQIIGQQDHYPYGESWYASGTTTKWQFTSYERDVESGNDYAVARFYINRLSRFYSPDPVDGNRAAPQTLDLYAYVADEPIDNIDPDGRISIAVGLGCGGGGDPGNPFGTPPFFPGGGFPWPPWWPGGIGSIGSTPPFVPTSGPLLALDPSAILSFALCRGTTDCSHYFNQCWKTTTWTSKAYYCVGAPVVCMTLGDTKYRNCVRLCLQEKDTCLNQPDPIFGACTTGLHIFCFSKCAPCLIL